MSDEQRVYRKPPKPWWRRILRRGRHHQTWRRRTLSCPVCVKWSLS